MRDWQKRWVAVVMEFVVLFVFWLVFSGRYELKYIIIGLIMSAIVTALTHDILFPHITKGKKEQHVIGYALRSAGRLVMYVLWLVLAIIKANIQVAAIVLNPRLPINPTLLQFKTQMKKEISLVTLANSITLTPGTITVDLKDNTYVLHALVPETAGDIETGLMQNKVGYIFGESKELPPKIIWAYSTEEFK